MQNMVVDMCEKFLTIGWETTAALVLWKFDNNNSKKKQNDDDDDNNNNNNNNNNVGSAWEPVSGSENTVAVAK